MNLSDISKMVPELVQTYLDRYEILRLISNNQPIGRRSIARMLELNERYVRKQTDFLTEFNYINTTEMGMNITYEGKEILKLSSKYAEAFRNVEKLCTGLKEKLGVTELHVVDADIGGCFNSGLFANAVADLVTDSIDDSSVIGITGGSTMKLIVDGMKPDKVKQEVIVVPARGSLGKKYEYQSNSIVEIMANKLGADYFTINFPDYMDVELLNSSGLAEDLLKYNKLVESINVLVFGVGRADVMANRRGLGNTDKSRLTSEGAVAEAFGNYFDIEGHKLFESKSIGMSLEGYRKVKRVIAVAFGTEKVEPIISLAKVRSDMCIIIDMECAEGLARYLKLN